MNRLNILEGIFSEGLADEYIELWAGKAASEDIASTGSFRCNTMTMCACAWQKSDIFPFVCSGS